MSRPRPDRGVRLAALVLIAAALAASCESLQPVATPADAPTIFQELARRGGSVTEIVAGETGCGDQGLVGNAIRFRLEAAGMTEPATVHLFMFRNRSAFEAAADSVEACRRSYEASGPGGVESVAVGTYRAFGAGWSAELRELLESTLAGLAGSS